MSGEVSGACLTHVRSLRRAVLLAVCCVFGACAEQAHRVPASQTVGVASFEVASELPRCNPSRFGEVYYVGNERRFLFCDGQRLRPIESTGMPGADGTSWLVALSAAAPQDCENGGVLIHIGPDTDRDGELDAAEIAASEPICSGADGEPGPAGPNGKNSLIATRPAPESVCPSGGIAVSSGLDENENGLLDLDEVHQTEHVCNGLPGDDTGDGTDGGGEPDDPASQIAAVLAAPEGPLSLPISGALVTYVMSDGDGFFLQAAPSGPALIVSADTQLDSFPLAGDIIALTVTGTAVRSGRKEVTGLTDLVTIGKGDPDAFAQDLSFDADVESKLTEYYSEYVIVTGEVLAAFEEQLDVHVDNSFVAAEVATAGLPAPGGAGMWLRVPELLGVELGLAAGCSFTVKAPLWRFQSLPMVSPWEESDFLALGCPL